MPAIDIFRNTYTKSKITLRYQSLKSLHDWKKLPGAPPGKMGIADKKDISLPGQNTEKI